MRIPEKAMDFLKDREILRKMGRIPADRWEGPLTVGCSLGFGQRDLPLRREGARLQDSQHRRSDSSLLGRGSFSNRPEVEGGPVSTERAWGWSLRGDAQLKVSIIRSTRLHLGFSSPTTFPFPTLCQGAVILGSGTQPLKALARLTSSPKPTHTTAPTAVLKQETMCCCGVF